MQIAEALGYLTGQSWLAPDEPISRPPCQRPTKPAAHPPRLGWRQAARQIFVILRRI
jgi:hypothetical protein